LLHQVLTSSTELKYTAVCYTPSGTFLATACRIVAHKTVREYSSRIG